MKKFSAEYWNQHYLENKAGWDIGNISRPIKEYIDQLTDKSIQILVPGAGNAYEVEYLYNEGFSNTYLLDFSEQSIRNFQKRCPDFPEENIIKDDFFTHKGTYNLIIEQTFFSSIPIQKRKLYVEKINALLKVEGKLVGLLFNHQFNFTGPPYGGTYDEYHKLFADFFTIDMLDIAYNSIKPRREREFFVQIRKVS